jgi:Lrp/AsnC family leucine-responsive transcriptional regulator
MLDPHARPLKGESKEFTPPMASERRQNGLLDGTNVRILEELQCNARLTVAELGRRVGLSAPAVAERMARLEDAGVITGYHAAVDPRALGYALGAVLRIRPAPRQIAAVAELAREIPEVAECHRITGEDCFLVRLHVRDVEQLEELIDRFAFHGQTTTSIMQTSPVARRPAPLPAQ